MAKGTRFGFSLQGSELVPDQYSALAAVPVIDLANEIARRTNAIVAFDGDNGPTCVVGGEKESIRQLVIHACRVAYVATGPAPVKVATGHECRCGKTHYAN
jgi:hypothetical protein